jgi:two-component system NarL family sensor kinase
MDTAPALTEATERRATARPEVRAAESTVVRPEPGALTESALRQLCDGLLIRLEAERTRVAAVLGDELVSVMTMARYLIEDAAQRVGRGELEQGSEGLQNASVRIRDATDRLVALCSELRPRVLDDLGLVAALSWYFRDFSQENRAIFVSPRITVSEPDVLPELRLPIFRIVQAALSNVARHSKASAVRVFLSMFEDELRLGVEDDGVGFDVDRWRHHRRYGNEGCGLGMMLRWAETSGGHFSIEAIPRHGARVLAFWRRHPARAARAHEPQATDRSAPSPV